MHNPEEVGMNNRKITHKNDTAMVSHGDMSSVHTGTLCSNWLMCHCNLNTIKYKCLIVLLILSSD